jgi:hypothetical protein
MQSRFAWAAVLTASLLVAAYGETAWAKVERQCSASVNGVPVGGDTIRVGRDATAHVEVVAPEGTTQNSVYLEFFGKRVKVASLESHQRVGSGDVQVSDYARWGAGLYKVVWEGLNEKSEVVCRTSAKVQVEGSPFGGIIGITAAAVIVIGLSAITLTWRAVINEGARWAVKVVFRGTFERDKTRGRLRIKPKLSFSQTLLGTLWGLFLGGGTLTTLQQAALSLPTIELALELVLPFTVFGLLSGLFRPVRG